MSLPTLKADFEIDFDAAIKDGAKAFSKIGKISQSTFAKYINPAIDIMSSGWFKKTAEYQKLYEQAKKHISYKNQRGLYTQQALSLSGGKTGFLDTKQIEQGAKAIADSVEKENLKHKKIKISSNQNILNNKNATVPTNTTTPTNATVPTNATAPKVKNNASQSVPAALYAFRFFSGKKGGIANAITGIAKNLNKWTRHNNFIRRAKALGRVLSRSGILTGTLAGGVIGVSSLLISSLIKKTNESIPYARALSGTNMTGLGSTMSSFQAAGFDKKRGLDWRANLVKTIGDIKLGKGDASILMSLGINALDSKENIQKQFIERLKSYDEDIAVALGQDFGFSYQEVMAARRGDLDERKMKYNEEYIKRLGEIGIQFDKTWSDVKVFFFNSIFSKLFNYADNPLKFAFGMTSGAINPLLGKIVANFPNLNINIDKNGKATIDGVVESNEIDYSSIYQQQGDSN